MAVDAARGLVVISGYTGAEDSRLFVYSLADGSLVRSFGGEGDGKGQFNWVNGGLCMTPRGTLLVAESKNNRLQEVNIDDGGWVRFVGEGLLEVPDFVTCSESVIGVMETTNHRVVLLSWVDGSLLARFGSGGSGDGLLDDPRGLRLLADGSGVVVADTDNNRLCVFSATGDFVRSLPSGKPFGKEEADGPYDVVEVDGGASFVVANRGDNTLCKVSSASGAVTPFGSGGCEDWEFDYPAALAIRFGGEEGSGNGQFNGPVALAMVPRGGSDGGVELVVLEADTSRFRVFR